MIPRQLWKYKSKVQSPKPKVQSPKANVQINCTVHISWCTNLLYQVQIFLYQVQIFLYNVQTFCTKYKYFCTKYKYFCPKYKYFCTKYLGTNISVQGTIDFVQSANISVQGIDHDRSSSLIVLPELEGPSWLEGHGEPSMNNRMMSWSIYTKLPGQNMLHT